MTRFELATPRPPDAYSNRTELHPELAFSKKALPRGGVFSKSDAKLIHSCQSSKLFKFFLSIFFVMQLKVGEKCALKMLWIGVVVMLFYI